VSGHVWGHPDHATFASEMRAAGLQVRRYRGRFYWEGPAVVVDDLQDALGVTTVHCQWDQMGLGWVVYPRVHATSQPTPAEDRASDSPSTGPPVSIDAADAPGGESE
jgi:hypothetical protein